MIRIILIITLLSTLLLPGVSFAGKGDKSIGVGIGEAWGPRNIRYSFGSSTTYDLGIDASGGAFYFGARSWSSAYYAGAGILIGTYPGFYGNVGYEFEFFDFLIVSPEFWAYTNTSMETGATALIILGVSW